MTMPASMICPSKPLGCRPDDHPGLSELGLDGERIKSSHFQTPKKAGSLTDHNFDDSPAIQESRLWCGDGWTAKVIKNEDDDGWAVAMIKDGEPEPALIGPWTMGRDKKNPKPLDVNAFHTLVKTASEFVRRHEQQLHASLHQSITVTARSERVTVLLDVVPDEDNPHALLSAQDGGGQVLAQARVAASFRLNRASATRWVENDFAKPAES